MPALPPVPQVLKVRHFFTVGSDANAVVTWHWSYTGTAPSNTTCATIASDIYTGYTSNMLAIQGTDVDITGIEVTDLTSPSAGQGEHLQTTAGTHTGSTNPAGAALLLNQPIPRRYRGGKPRTYWPLGTAADLTTRQQWSSTFITAASSAFQAYLDVLFAIVVSGTALSNWTNVSYYEGFTVRPNPPIAGVRSKNIPTLRATPVTDIIGTFVVNGKVASQRRRNLHSV